MIGKTSNQVGGEKQPPLLNLANALTGIRIAIIPVFAFFVIISAMNISSWQIAACIMFCIAAATDYADGRIARSRNLVTSFGKVADPIADKALIGTALVLLSCYGRLPWWVTTIILIREVGVTGLRFWVIRRAVIAASLGGKIKTALQVVAIAWCLAPLPPRAELVGTWIAMAAVLVTVVTGLDYLVKAVRVRQEPAPEPLTDRARGDSAALAHKEAG